MDNEIKVMERGSYYLTPFLEEHVHEFIHIIHPENVRELTLLGHTNIADALREVAETSDVYLVRDGNDEIIFVGGVILDLDNPQMFAMFTTKIRDNFTLLARGSKMLTTFFDKTYPVLTMSINAQYDIMVNWAAWLGFEPIGLSEYKNQEYVEFVRCNPSENFVVSKSARPVMH